MYVIRFQILIQLIILTNCMKKQLISFDPEIVQFVSDREQLVKVSNLTAQNIDNCFFCMFNTQKYKFIPDYFSLQPHEQKLITVNFLGKLAPRQVKQFAYLKSSSNFSKRITLINGPATISEQKFKSPESGVQELGTLSSRQYRDSQIQGLQKIIADKQAYIQRLQRINQQLKDFSNKKASQYSQSKTKNYYLNEIEDLQLKMNIVNTQKDELIKQNILLQQKFEEYKDMMANQNKFEQINDLLVQKDQLLKWQKQQKNFHENQCQKLMCRVSQLENKLSQNQKIKNNEIIDLQKKRQETIKKLQDQLAKNKQASNKAAKIYEERIMQLEEEIVEGNTDRKRLTEMEQMIEKKKKQIQKINKQLKQEKEIRVRIQENQYNSKILENEKHELTSRLKNMEKSLQQLKCENFMYKSKIQNHDLETSKVGQYLQVALQSCKNENQILKQSKVDLEREIQQRTKAQKNSENKIQTLQRQYNRMVKQIQEARQQKQALLDKNRQIKQQNHETLIRLKNENIDLIDKINVFNKQKKKDEQIDDLQKQIKQKQRVIQQMKSEVQLSKKQNEKLMKRIERTRKQTKKQIKSLQDDTLSELKKVKYQKQSLTKKIAQLQESLNNSQTYEISRAKTKTHYDTPNHPNANARTRCPRSQGERKLGIRNQRKQLEESRTSSNQQQIDLQGLYSELGQLRQYKSYMNNELQKLGKMVGVEYLSKQNDRNEQNRSTIFATISFFDEFKQNLYGQQQKTQRVSALENENNFLKGRITQLQYVHKQNKELHKQLPSEIQFQKQQNNHNLIEYIRREMRNQYSKQFDALKLADQKFNILKKKIYEEYRSRIVGILAKNKDDKTVIRIQSILERFTEGLSNLSHKEAVLAKEVKLKISARKQAQNLRAKVKHLTQLLEMKKGYCSREPLNIYMCQNQNQWHDYARLQAKVLSQQAELSKLQQQLDLSKTNANYLEQQLKLNLTDLKQRQDEVLKLKRQIVKIEKQTQKQLTKRQQQLESLQKRYFEHNTSKKGISYKESQFQTMKQDLNRKRQIIKNLKQKQKMLQQLLESTQRNQSEIREKSRRDIMEEQRKDNALRQMKEINRQLRSQNRKMKDQLQSLTEQLHSKINALKRIKNDGDQHRIRTLKTDEQTVERLKNQINSLKEQLTKSRQALEKLKKKKQKGTNQLQEQIKKQHNEYQIKLKTLESIIRALVDTLRRIYIALHIHMKKKGKHIEQAPNFDELSDNPSQIHSLKVYEKFENVIEALKD